MDLASRPVDEQVAGVADRLSTEFSDSVESGVVRDLVDRAYTPYREARVTQFVPVLVARSVRQQLRRTS